MIGAPFAGYEAYVVEAWLDYAHNPEGLHGLLQVADGTRGAGRLGLVLKLDAVVLAEAHVHGVELDEVHFHELADWDSLLDIVAAGAIAAFGDSLPIEFDVLEMRPAAWRAVDVFGEAASTSASA